MCCFCYVRTRTCDEGAIPKRTRHDLDTAFEAYLQDGCYRPPQHPHELFVCLVQVHPNDATHLVPVLEIGKLLSRRFTVLRLRKTFMLGLRGSFR